MAEDAPLPEADRVEGHPHPREAVRLLGQAEAERAFMEAWKQGRLHHAWLIRGAAGIGKATLAYRIARALIAQPGTGGTGLFGDGPGMPDTLDAPADCPVRTRILSQAEPRLFVLRRAMNTESKPPRMRKEIIIDDVRRLRRFLSLSAADGGWRVVIVDAADEMNRASANALLKFLEEPPPDCLFLLISHAPAGLLPTIRSRCRTLDLAPLDAAAIATILSDTGAQIDPGIAPALATLGAGSAGEALRLVAADGPAQYGRIVRMFGEGRRIDRPAMTDLAEQCSARAAADRYAMVLKLLHILTARFARAAVIGASPVEAAEGEHRLMSIVASRSWQGAHWAEAAQRISATTRHAVAVNLDPAQTIVDTFLELDATLGRVQMTGA